jgi:3-oxosteroid 1-dehydrogenase
MALGLDAAGFRTTLGRFNANARAGYDPDFSRGEALYLKMFRGDERHRPNPVLGPVEKPPFYGMQLLLLGTAIGSAGVRAGIDARVLTEEGKALTGLYAVGAAAGRTSSGTGYNSGFSLSRALTFGWLAARDLARRSTL